MEGTNSEAEGNVATPAACATYQDMLDAPEHMVAEIIEGRHYVHPRSGSRHATANSVLGARLGMAFHSGDGGPERTGAGGGGRSRRAASAGGGARSPPAGAGRRVWVAWLTVVHAG